MDKIVFLSAAEGASHRTIQKIKIYGVPLVTFLVNTYQRRYIMGLNSEEKLIYYYM